MADRGTIARLAAIATDVRFKTKHARLIFGWCIEHFTSYDDAPGAAAINDCFSISYSGELGNGAMGGDQKVRYGAL